MNIPTQNIKIQNEKFGLILNENFVNPVQFKLFLKLINGCLMSKEDLTFFNGNDFFINVPYDILRNSVITTGFEQSYTLADHIINKSKIEQPA
jgi:hypothetical protein